MINPVVKEGTNTLIFYIFEYDAESGAECSAESGAKQYQCVKIGVILVRISPHSN